MSVNGDLFACFGYGSLVNRKTLSADLVTVFPATLRGWRRQWQARDMGKNAGLNAPRIALLSVRRDPECSIEGMVFIDRNENLLSLEKREKFYQPQTIDVENIRCDSSNLQLLNAQKTHVYAVPATPQDEHPGTLLRSYLDVVMQGFLAEFGASGLDRFVETTDWRDLQVLEDRNAPIYPRHQQMSDAEIKLFDSIIS